MTYFLDMLYIGDPACSKDLHAHQIITFHLNGFCGMHVYDENMYLIKRREVL